MIRVSHWRIWGCFLALMAGQSVAQETLSVCFVADDLPRSEQKTGTGLDIDLLKAISQQMGVELKPVWTASADGMVEMEESDLPLDQLADGQCDVAASIGGELVLGEDADKFRLSKPYVGAAFELIGGDDMPNTLQQAKEVGLAVQSVSLAHLVLQKQGVKWQSYETPAAQLVALRAGEVSGALIWGANLAGTQWQPVANYEPPPVLRWNHHLAVRQADAQLLVRLQTALDTLLANGTVQSLYKQWGIPYRAVFDDVFSYAALDSL